MQLGASSSGVAVVIGGDQPAGSAGGGATLRGTQDHRGFVGARHARHTNGHSRQ